jgi:4-aminobutyrate aminotransferase / (S)-3-amino-2-methylpropionate transaminase / 5-aminovalerate transaminase
MFNIKSIKVTKIKTKNRFIGSKIPAVGTSKILMGLKKNEARSMHGQLPIVWNKAKNFNVYDIKNNKFIDFTSTIFVANIGHSNLALKKKITETINDNLINTYAYPSIIRDEYLKKLINFSKNGFEKAYLLSSGSEALEACIKVIRLYSLNQKKGSGIITISGNWHGRTTGSQLLSDNKDQSCWIKYKKKEVYHLRFPYPWLMKKLNKTSIEILNEDLKNLSKKINLRKDISGVILETFQGWGALFYPKEYVKKLSTICKKYKILLAFDEIQAGFGRTGKKFGFEHYNVKPDMICCGKAMGGGIPISALIGKKKYLDIPKIGSMSSTHSANPVACAAGLAVINEINQKKLIKASKDKGFILSKELLKIKKKYSHLIELVPCKGLLAAIIFRKDLNNINKLVGKVCEKCMQKGLLVVYTGRESIKLGPPLTITKDALIEALEVIDESIQEVFLK